MTRPNNQDKLAYTRPSTEVVNIETQTMIASSVSSRQMEDLGSRKEEIEWTNESRGSWGNLWN